MSKFAALSALILLLSCNSPEARLERLQHNFWEKFARQDFFEVKLKNEVLHLPLPPTNDQPEHRKELAENLQKEARSIQKENLNAAGQKQLVQIQSALEDCVAHAGNAFFDPSSCTVSSHLEQLTGHPELPLFLEKIPTYYAQIEQRWQTPDLRFVPKAVAESQNTLDLLHQLGEKSGVETAARAGAAKAAVKDFIGLCQSAVLGTVVK